MKEKMKNEKKGREGGTLLTVIYLEMAGFYDPTCSHRVGLAATTLSASSRDAKICAWLPHRRTKGERLRDAGDTSMCQHLQFEKQA